MAILTNIELPVTGYTAITILILAYIVYSAVYTLYFHPLAKYPGPLLAKLSVWPSFIHSLRGDRHLWLYHLSKTYGPVFRYRPDSILMNTPSALKTLYGGTKTTTNVRKSEYYATWRVYDAHDTWGTDDPAIHAPKRRALNNAFSDRALRSMEPFVIEHTDRWINLLADEIPSTGSWTPPINFSSQINYLVLDLLTDLCFGRSLHVKEPGNEEMRFVQDVIIGLMSFIDPIARSPFQRPWNWLKPRGLDYVFDLIKPQGLRKWTNFAHGTLEKRMELQRQLKDGTTAVPPRHDMFHYVFEGQDPLDADEDKKIALRSESETLIIAGSDTTSTTMSAAMFYLSRYPAVQQKLAAEIRSVFKSSNQIASGPELNSCEYLRAVINETLRVCPPVPAELPREVIEPGIAADGHFLPAGTKVAVSAYCLHHNEEIYSDPFTFRPERWIEDEDGKSVSQVGLAESAFCPFSIGVRGCVGKNLAMLEMLIVLAKFMYKFEIRTDVLDKTGAGGEGRGWMRENEKQFQVRECFICDRDGPVIQLRARG